MIISASRRTDIPAFYADWFIRRLEEGFALVSNPMNAKQIRRVDLSPGAVDGFVFWTKNPQPMIPMLGRLRDYPYYFQFTLNAYGRDVEANVPSAPALIDAFKALSDSAGGERVVWRYDPILVSPAYTIGYHVRRFEELARSLEGRTEKCIISFVDFYRKISADVRALGIARISDAQKRDIAARFADIAFGCGMKLETCAEDIELGDLGIGHAHCVDAGLLSRIAGRPIAAGKDRNQRPACGCSASVDIGAYNTCLHGCRYCYANHSAAAVERNRLAYDVDSPMLCGRMGEGNAVTEKAKPIQ